MSEHEWFLIFMGASAGAVAMRVFDLAIHWVSARKQLMIADIAVKAYFKNMLANKIKSGDEK
jgi:hypothetical protein